MEKNREISIDWEESTISELDHYPENFVYSFIRKEAKTVIYIASAYLESPKAEIPKKLARLGLKAQKVQIVIGYLDTITSTSNILPEDLVMLQRYLHCKYQPHLNKTVSFDEIEKDRLKVKGDDLMSVFSLAATN